MKQAIFSQYFGIGDVIFAQGVANKFAQEGYNITWPVMPHFVDGLSVAYPHIKFLPYTIFDKTLFEVKSDVVAKGIRIVPIRWADQILGVPPAQWMRAKYDLYGLDYKKWKLHAEYKRNIIREKTLAAVYGVRKNEDFVLVNNLYNSELSGKRDILVNTDLKVINMRHIEGYSLFDYSWMIENATEIHVVNSSILYLLELLDYKAHHVHIYARPTENGGFPHVDYLMTKNYILHS